MMKGGLPGLMWKIVPWCGMDGDGGMRMVGTIGGDVEMWLWDWWDSVVTTEDGIAAEN